MAVGLARRIATIQPGYLTRDQIITLRLIKDAYPERAVYFSTGGYGRTLGFGNYTLRQGLAEKLVEVPIVASKDTIRVGFDFSKPLKSRRPSQSVMDQLRAQFRGGGPGRPSEGQAPPVPGTPSDIDRPRPPRAEGEGPREGGLGREGVKYAIEDMTEPRLLVLRS